MSFLSDLAGLAAKGTKMAVKGLKDLKKESDELYMELSSKPSSALKDIVRHSSGGIKRTMAAKILNERGELTREDFGK
ncbi:hypothetical protein II898_06380 [bacterium]|nr:hypothetical protein [bacterium]